MPDLHPDLLSRTAARCATDPAFLGHTLAQAGTRAEVAVRLGVGVETVEELSLHLVPETETALLNLCGRFGVRADRLREVLRNGS